jgi:DNA modification methylase
MPKSANANSGRLLEIVYRTTSSLTPFENNARHHPRRQMGKLRSAIETFGFTSPLIIDEHGVVLCGNLRLATAIAMKLGQVPTIKLEGLSKAERRALVLADNRISQEASWDRQKLKMELEALQELGFELELTAFDTLEIESTLNLDGEPAANDADDDSVDLDSGPVLSRLGDLWLIGEHRVFCGDARASESYQQLMDDQLASAVFSDPPYAIPIKNHVSGHGRVKHDNFVMGCGETSDEEFFDTILKPALVLMGKHSAPGAVAFVCCDWRHVSLFEKACAEAFHEVKTLAVWAKTNASNSGLYRPQFELVWVWQTKAGDLQNNIQMGRSSAGLGTKGRNRSNLWTFAGANVFRKGRLEDLADHSTVKPKKMVAEAIRDVTKVGDIVLDGFLGSGTTCVAAAMTGRRGYGIELDPKFVDVALRRIALACGQVPRLSTGETLLEVAAARLGDAADTCALVAAVKGL